MLPNYYVSAQVIFKKNRKILFLKRKNVYLDGYYCLPGGHVESNETVLEAAAREVHEEIGLQINPINFEIIHIGQQITKNRHYIDYFLKPKDWKGLPKIMEADKCSKLLFEDLNRISPLVPSVCFYLKKIEEGFLSSVFDSR